MTLDATGLTIKRLATIQNEITESLRAAFGEQINTFPQSVFGQLIGIFSEREALIWELVEEVYNSQYPDTAIGSSLDNVAAIVGQTRNPALASQIIGQAMFGTPGTIIPPGTVFSVNGDPTSKFSTLSEVTLIAGVDEIQDITFSATPTSGSFKLNYKAETTAFINWDDAAIDIQNALNALSGLSSVTVAGSFAAGFTITFTGSDGLREQPLLVESNNTLDAGGAVSITITETTPGVYQGQSNMVATATGEIVGNAGTVSVIDNPIAGLVSTFNPEDAILGNDIESDAEFRIRRSNRLQISLAGPLEAIVTAVFALNDIEGSIQLEEVKGFENTSLIADPSGRPGKSFEIVVFQAGAVTTRDQEIANAIFLSKPAGIEAHGDVSKTVIDSMGFSHTIKFSRPVEVDIYLDLDLTVDANYPTNGDDQVKAAIVAWGNNLGSGQDVIVYPALVAQLNAIPGIIDVVVRIGIAADPTLDDNIDIDDGTVLQVEISRWDISRIIILQV